MQWFGSMSGVTIEIESLELEGFDPAHRFVVEAAFASELQRLVDAHTGAWEPSQRRSADAPMAPHGNGSGPADTGIALAQSVFSVVSGSVATTHNFGR